MSLERQIRQVLAELELISHGSTQSWNASGGHTGEPDDQVAMLAGHPDTPPHLYWRHRFAASTASQHAELLEHARAELDAYKRSNRIDPAYTDRELLEQRILNEGAGWTPDEVARVMRCPASHVRKVRVRDGRNADDGKRIALSDVPADQRDQARDLLTNGMTERQVQLITGLSKSTIRRINGKAA